MFLKNISLKNFKCHETLNIDFNTTTGGKSQNRKTTFLVGENGTGKSALLQAIAMVTGGSEALRSLGGFPDDYIRYGQNTCEITATITTAQGEERTLSLTLERGELPGTAIERAKTTLAPMDAALRHTQRSYFTAGFGSGRRITRPNGSASYYYTPRNARYAAVHSLFGSDVLLRPLYEWTGELLERGGVAAIATLGNALNTFLPPEVRFHSCDPMNARMLFQTPDGVLPLELLSNGHQQTVAWVSDLLYHVTRNFGDYKAPLAARGLLLIDEIDLHLHPAWQRQIYAFLAQGLPNFQVIATTYSPLTAQQARMDELFTLRRNDEGKTVIDPITSEPAWLLWQQLLPGDSERIPTIDNGKTPLWKGAGTRAGRLRTVHKAAQDRSDDPTQEQTDITATDEIVRAAA